MKLRCKHEWTDQGFIVTAEKMFTSTKMGIWMSSTIKLFVCPKCGKAKLEWKN